MLSKTDGNLVQAGTTLLYTHTNLVNLHLANGPNYQ